MQECRHRARGERIERTIGCTCINEPKQGAAFSISIPRHIARQHQHINTKEMHAVEQALLYWGRRWSRKRVIMHIDNQAVVHALKNQTIRGATMTVLRRCLLLATEYDLEFEARWIPTSDNALADALSRFNYEKVTNVAPQLIYPTCTLRDRGFLMYSKPDYLPQRHITFGARWHQRLDRTTIPLGLASHSFATSLATDTKMVPVFQLRQYG